METTKKPLFVTEFQFQEVQLKENQPALAAATHHISIPRGAVKRSGRPLWSNVYALFQFQEVQLKERAFVGPEGNER